jgi:hypothetical protein
MRSGGFFFALPGKSIHPEISPLRSPGFPVETSGVDRPHAVSFTGNRTRGPGKCGEVGNPGTLRFRDDNGKGGASRESSC